MHHDDTRLPASEGQQNSLLVICATRDQEMRICSTLKYAHIAYRAKKSRPTYIMEFGLQLTAPSEIYVASRDVAAAEQLLRDLRF